MRVSRGLRVVIGLFNTVAAGALAAYGSAFPFSFIRREDLAFHLTTAWAAAGAAAVATFAIAFDLALPAWIALGYLFWVALLAGHALAIVFLALAISLAPVLPRPGRSLSGGFAVAVVTAAALALLRSAM